MSQFSHHSTPEQIFPHCEFKNESLYPTVMGLVQQKDSFFTVKLLLLDSEYWRFCRMDCYSTEKIYIWPGGLYMALLLLRCQFHSLHLPTKYSCFNLFGFPHTFGTMVTFFLYLFLSYDKSSLYRHHLLFDPSGFTSSCHSFLISARVITTKQLLWLFLTLYQILFSLDYFITMVSQSP